MHFIPLQDRAPELLGASRAHLYRKLIRPNVTGRPQLHARDGEELLFRSAEPLIVGAGETLQCRFPGRRLKWQTTSSRMEVTTVS